MTLGATVERIFHYRFEQTDAPGFSLERSESLERFVVHRYTRPNLYLAAYAVT